MIRMVPLEPVSLFNHDRSWPALGVPLAKSSCDVALTTSKSAGLSPISAMIRDRGLAEAIPTDPAMHIPAKSSEIRAFILASLI
ncbi:MAG: hypothetical protein AAF496_05185 [Pseudomonadota bacterium]